MKHDLTASSKIINELRSWRNPTRIYQGLFSAWYIKARASRLQSILIKLNRVMNVVSILSKHDQLPDDILYIKPDMTNKRKTTYWSYFTQRKVVCVYHNKEFQKRY